MAKRGSKTKGTEQESLNKKTGKPRKKPGRKSKAELLAEEELNELNSHVQDKKPKKKRGRKKKPISVPISNLLGPVDNLPAPLNSQPSQVNDTEMNGSMINEIVNSLENIKRSMAEWQRETKAEINELKKLIIESPLKALREEIERNRKHINNSINRQFDTHFRNLKNLLPDKQGKAIQKTRKKGRSVRGTRTESVHEDDTGANNNKSLSQSEEQSAEENMSPRNNHTNQDEIQNDDSKRIANLSSVANLEVEQERGTNTITFGNLAEAYPSVSKQEESIEKKESESNKESVSKEDEPDEQNEEDSKADKSEHLSKSKTARMEEEEEEDEKPESEKENEMEIEDQEGDKKNQLSEEFIAEFSLN